MSFWGAGGFRDSTATASLSILVDVSIMFARTALTIGISIVSQVERPLTSLSVGGGKTSEFRSKETAISFRRVRIKVRLTGRGPVELDLEL